MYAASAIAANTVARSACGAAAPLFTDQMFSALGIGGGGSLVGGVAALLALIPFLFYKYGERIRIKSRFAPTDHKKEHDEADKAEKGRATPPDEGDTTTAGGMSDSGTVTDQEGDHEHRGDRESLDSNPYEYAADIPNPPHHRSESSQSGMYQADER